MAIFTVPTRDELEAFLPDQRTIRAFENMFKAVTIIEQEQVIIENPTDSRVFQTESVSNRALQTAKGNQVLVWLSM